VIGRVLERINTTPEEREAWVAIKGQCLEGGQERPSIMPNEAREIREELRELTTTIKKLSEVSK